MATKRKPKSKHQRVLVTPPVDIPGEPIGTNCLLSVPKYGSRGISVIEAAYDISIASEEDSSANSKAFYPLNTVSSDFSLVAIFKTHASRDSFQSWVSTYMSRATTSGNVSGYIAVSIPGRSFYRKAVLSGTLEYGDTVGEIAPKLTLTFVGASAPISSAITSGYVPPKNKGDAAAAAFAYPDASTQVGGAASYEDTIFASDVITYDQAYDDWQHMIMSGTTFVPFEVYYNDLLNGVS